MGARAKKDMERNSREDMAFTDTVASIATKFYKVEDALKRIEDIHAGEATTDMERTLTTLPSGSTQYNRVVCVMGKSWERTIGATSLTDLPYVWDPSQLRPFTGDEAALWPFSGSSVHGGLVHGAHAEVRDTYSGSAVPDRGDIFPPDAVAIAATSADGVQVAHPAGVGYAEDDCEL